VLDLQQQLANLNAQIDAHSMEESLVDIESDEYSTQVRISSFFLTISGTND